MSIMSGVRVLDMNNDMKKILFLIIAIATFFSCSGKSPADDNVYSYQVKMLKYQNESKYIQEVVQDVFYVIEKYKDNRRILFYVYSRPYATFREYQDALNIIITIFKEYGYILNDINDENIMEFCSNSVQKK